MDEEKKYNDENEGEDAPEEEPENNEEDESHDDSRKENKSSKINGWKISTFVLVILLAVSIFAGGVGLNFVSGNAVAENAVLFINENLLQGQSIATLDSVESENGVYKALINVAGQSTPVYITKDGNLMFLQAIPLTGELSLDNNQQNNQNDNQEPLPPADVPKSDKPVVEAFIMSHCPFGTQIEKGLLPVAKLLGDNIDFDIKFVYYVMHGDTEVYEQLNQYCIQEEQNDKYLDYLECFLTDGDGERCLAEVGIDMTALEACTAAADEEFSITANFEDQASWLSGRYPLFNTHKEDNEKYGVGGSPTLVINGEKVSAARDSASLLDAVCGAFNEAPEECNTEFESETPSTGFGWDTTSSNNLATCG